MSTLVPSFYGAFRCEPSLCQHSCCIDWEIGVDEESLRRYRERTDALAKHICSHIAYHPEPSFVLTEDERCPFLQKDGLCSLIVAEGEAVLPEICREHPRFRNFYDGDITELSVGLSCEMAISRLLEEDKPYFLVYPEEIDSLTELSRLAPTPLSAAHFSASADKDFLLRKYELLSHFLDTDTTFFDALNTELSAHGLALFLKGVENACRALVTLETLEFDFQGAYELLSERIRTDGARACLGYCRTSAYTEREKCSLFAMTLFRHATAESFYSLDTALAFSIFFVTLACCLCSEAAIDKQQAIRLISSEIEYSEENTDILLSAFDE